MGVTLDRNQPNRGAQGHYSERKAADVFRTILKVVVHCQRAPRVARPAVPALLPPRGTAAGFANRRSNLLPPASYFCAGLASSALAGMGVVHRDLKPGAHLSPPYSLCSLVVPQGLEQSAKRRLSLLRPAVARAAAGA